jgi:hypothetical protein
MKHARLTNEWKDLIEKTVPSEILWSESSFGPIPLIKTSTLIHEKKQLADTEVSPIFRAFIKGNRFALYVIIYFREVSRQFVFELYDPDPEKLKLFFAMILKLKILTFNDEPYLSTGIGVPIRDEKSLVEMLRRQNLSGDNA